MGAGAEVAVDGRRLVLKALTPIPALRNGVTLHPTRTTRVAGSTTRPWAWARCQWSSRPPATGVGYTASGSTSWRSTSAPTCAIPAASRARRSRRASSRQASPAWPERPTPDLLATPTEGGLSRAIGTASRQRMAEAHNASRCVALCRRRRARRPGRPHARRAECRPVDDGFRGLADQCTVVLHDHRCNGRSTGPPAASMTWENLTADADALREYLGFDRWAVLGHFSAATSLWSTPSGTHDACPGLCSSTPVLTPAGPARTLLGFCPSVVTALPR